MDPEVLELNAHSELCVNQAYCLNGGTCYRLMALGRLYCECAESFEGERCHLKTVGISDMSKHYEEGLWNWNRLLPIATVVAVAILFMVALVCIYVCAKKCYQYSITTPVKVLRYQNASAQTSISQVYLLAGGDTHCNGQLASAMISSSRTRLTACSTTPDNVDSSLHNFNQSRRSCPDLESGSCSEAELREPGHASTHPWIVVTEYDATEDNTDHGIIAAAAAAGSTPIRFQQKTNCQGASAPCFSPNDSNNNAEVVFACNSPRQVAGPARVTCDERTTLLFQPRNCIPNNCVRDSDSRNNIAVNNVPSDLYDSDPEATAL